MAEPSYGRDLVKAERLFSILNLLRERTTVTAKELAAYCHTTVRTIYRDMQLLEGIGVQYVTEGKLGYRLVYGPSSPNRFLSREEWVALTVYPLLAKNITSSSHPAYHAYRSGLEKVKSLTHERSTAGFSAFSEELGDRIRFHDQAGDKDTNNVMPALFRAIAENRVIEMEYYAIYRDKTSNRRIHPYYIIPRGGHLYITAYCVKREDFRVFRLNRIRSAQVIEETFSISEQFDIDEFLAERWTIFAEDEKPTMFRVRFHPDIARYVYEFNFYANTELVTEEDGSVLLTTTLQSKREFMRWVRGFGLDAEVLEPAEVRREMRTEHEKQMHRYRI